jgi:hypothetical protein
MDRRARRVQFAAKRIVIGEFAMVRFGVRISRRAHGLKIAPGQRRFVLRQGMPGRPAGSKQNDCDKRRENGEGKVAKLGVVQGGTAEKLLTGIHGPASLFLTALFSDSFVPAAPFCGFVFLFRCAKSV